MRGTAKRPAGGLPVLWLAASIAMAGVPPFAAHGQEAQAPVVASGNAEEGKRLREWGDEYASEDRHAEAIRAYRAAVAADPSLGPEIAPSLGASLLWANRTAEAVPVLSAAAARNPGDAKTRKLLALAYRWSDRLDEAERLSRKTLAEEPGDFEERNGLAVALLWQGRHREAATEFERVLAAKPDDVEALLGLSRARLEMDLPEDAEGPAASAVAIAPGNAEAAEQLPRVRHRLVRYFEGEIRGSHDSTQLTLWEFSVGAHGRPAPGLDIGGIAKELLFRQGSPGKDANIDRVDSVNGTGGALLLAYHPAPSYSLRASAGMVSYDVADFRPWVGSAGATWFPGDLWRFSLDWDRAPYDTILSLQNHVTVDTLAVSTARSIPWKTEITATAALLFQHNRNNTGQPTENQGARFELGLARRLYLEGEGTRLTGLARLTYLGFQKELDVGMYNPRRQTAEEVGLDGRWAFRPRWEAFGTAMAGAQQEEGAGGSPTYSLELGVDREVGAAGKITLGAFAADSAAAGRGAGYRRQGGYLRFRVPF